MIIRGQDGGGGILEDKTVLCWLNWRIGSEGGGGEGGIDDLHPITLMAGQKSWNFVKGLLVGGRLTDYLDQLITGLTQ